MTTESINGRTKTVAAVLALFLGALSASAAAIGGYMTLKLEAHANMPAHSGVVPIVRAEVALNVSPVLQSLLAAQSATTATQAAILVEQKRMNEAIERLTEKVDKIGR